MAVHRESSVTRGSVLVAGATGGVGRHVVARLLRQGVATRAMTRDRSRAAGMAGVDVVEGSAFVPSDCARAVADCGAVVCTIGEHRMPDDGRIVDGDGVIHLIDTAEAAGVQRFVLVSSLGVGETWRWLPFPVRWGFRALGLVPIFEAKARSDARLRASRLTWTILFPAFLTNRPMTAEPLVVNEGHAGGTSSRQAVADVAVRCLTSSNATGTSLIVVDHHMRFTHRGEGSLHLNTPWEPW